jgi:hypothetical protein
MRRIGVVVCVLAIWASVARAEITDFGVKPSDLEVALSYSANPYIPFELGASVYLGKVAKIEPATRPVARNAEGTTNPANRIEGHVTLQISEVLRGAKADSVTLHYGYWKVFPGGARDPIPPDYWPRIEELGKDQHILCVVIPGPFKNNPLLANEPSWAVAVYLVNGADDPTVKAYRLMIGLHALRGPALTDAAMKAADQTNAIVRAYLASTAEYRLQRSDGVALLTAVTKIYLQPGAPDEGIDNIGVKELGIAGRGNEAVKVSGIRALVALLESPIRYVRQDAMDELHDIVKGLRTSDCYFPAGERNRLRDIVAKAVQDADEKEDAEEVVNWLGAAPGVLVVPATIFAGYAEHTEMLIDDPYYTFHHGAAIYVTRIVDRHQTSGPDPDTAQKLAGQDIFAGNLVGDVSLQITSVLQGAKRQTLTLAYTYNQYGSSGSVWPDLYHLPKDKQLLCVVMPKPGLPDEVKSDADLYACDAIPVSGPDDPLVKATAAMLTWDALEGPELKKALLGAADSTNLARLYLCQTACERLAPADAIDVLAAINKSMIRAAPPIDGADAYFVLRSMDIELGPSATSDPALQDKVIHAAADAADTTNNGLAIQVVEELPSLAQQAPDGARSLSARQKQGIRSTVARFSQNLSADEQSRVLQWLDR